MNQLEFKQGIMKLSAYDPLSKQYETRILSLPEVPSLEPLECLINNESIKPLRLTKSCNKQQKSATNIRRCQSNPNLELQKKKTASFIRSKRTLSGAFQAVTGFIQKKIRHQQEWSNETWYDEIRLSSDSSISTLNLNTPSYPTRQTIALSKENWWNLSPPISSF